MSNPKKAIDEIKSLMVKFGFMSSEHKFLDAVLEDGTKIKIEGDELVEGAKVVVVTEEGEIPAPDGVHSFEDETKVETVDGIITKIESYEVREEEMEEVEVEVPGEVATIAEPVVEAIVEAIIPVLEEIKSMADEMKKMKEKMSSFKSDFEDFKKEPAGKKISDGKTDFNKQSNSANELDARVAAITALRKK
jgi:Mg2+ and Co2+ transporter CorA